MIGDDDARVELSAAWSDLGEALELLDDRDVEILHLRFYQDMTQSEIAERVGVSQMHVSRLIRGALATLRENSRIDRADLLSPVANRQGCLSSISCGYPSRTRFAEGRACRQ